MTEMFSNPASTKTLSMVSGLCCFAGWLVGVGGMSVSSFVFKNFADSSRTDASTSDSRSSMMNS